MEEITISAEEQPELAQQMIEQALLEASQPSSAEVLEEAKSTTIQPPSDVVELLGGLYNSFTGELVETAQIRELNGEDEEIISRAVDSGRALLTILQRGTVKVGDQPATPDLLDSLLAGDREHLLVQIRRVTFGDEIPFEGPCPKCSAEDQRFTVDLGTLNTQKLEDPIKDRSFTIETKMGEVVVQLPLGDTQKRLIQAKDKTSAELDSILLKDCIVSVNGLPVIDQNMVKKMGIQDRRAILNKIVEVNPGPLLADLATNCPSCGQEVPLPLTLAELFRL